MDDLTLPVNPDAPEPTPVAEPAPAAEPVSAADSTQPLWSQPPPVDAQSAATAAAPVWGAPAPVPPAFGSPSYPPPAQLAPPTGYPPVWGVAPQPAAPAKKPVGTARILVGVGALLSIALGGGVGTYIVHTKKVHNQQVTAAALAKVVARPPSQSAGVRADGSHYGPLFAYLLPVPSGYTLGPADGNYGNNTSLTASQINGDVEGLLSGEPQSDMSSARGTLADVAIKFLAVRTYTNVNTSLVVEIALVQSDTSDATKNATTFNSLISDANIFRQGPTVPGYPQATCVLPPGLGSDTIDSMICTAPSGDIEVRVNAYGTAPLDQNAIAQLVSQQLDLLKTNPTIG